MLEWGTQGVAEGQDPEVGEIGQQAEYENLPPSICGGVQRGPQTREDQGMELETGTRSPALLCVSHPLKGATAWHLSFQHPAHSKCTNQVAGRMGGPIKE